jgi:hypothetical protein
MFMKYTLMMLAVLCGIQTTYAEDAIPPVTQSCHPVKLEKADKFNSADSLGAKGKAGVHGFATGIGEWSIADGAVTAIAAKPGDPKWPNGHEAVGEYNTDLGDIVTTGEFKLGTSPRISYVCRDTQNPNNHLCRVIITPKNISIVKMSGISKTTKAEVIKKLDVATDPNTWHHITVEICGDHLLAKVDDHVLEAHHERFKDRKGRIGLNANGEGAQFRNYEVWSAAPKE